MNTSLRAPLTPEDVAGAWDSVAALGLPPHVRALLEDAKVAQARARARASPLPCFIPAAPSRSYAVLRRAPRAPGGAAHGQGAQRDAGVVHGRVPRARCAS